MPPKRPMTDMKDSDRPDKKSKRGEKEEDEVSEVTAELGRKNEDYYEFENGDLEGPKHGAEDDSKLALNLREKTTGRTITFSYTRPDKKHFDWNDEQYVRSLQKWRRQYLREYGFPLNRIVRSWQPQENAWLELFFRLLQQSIDSGEPVRRPTNNEITDRFNKLFEKRRLVGKNGKRLLPCPARTVDSIASKLKQRNELGRLGKSTKEKCSDDQTLPLDLPTITWEQLGSFMSDVTVIPRSERNNAGRGVRKDTCATKDHKSLSNESETVGGEETVSNTDVMEGESQIYTSDNDEQPTIAPVGRFIKPVETASLLTPPDEIKEMIKDGWSIPLVTSADAAAKMNEDPSDTLEDSWMKGAVEEFEHRWREKAFGYGPETTVLREQWYRDWKQDPTQQKPKSGKKSRSVRRKLPPEELALSAEERDLARRRPEAQSVNALLAYASCPPLGYGGDINALKRDKALPKFELALAKENERTLAAHSHNFFANYPKRFRR